MHTLCITQAVRGEDGAEHGTRTQLAMNLQLGPMALQRVLHNRQPQARATGIA